MIVHATLDREAAAAAYMISSPRRAFAEVRVRIRSRSGRSLRGA